MMETGIVCGELVAPVPATAIAEVYVPGESPARLAVTISELEPVPDAGETDNHATDVEAFQLRVPVPELLMLMVCDDGFVPPCVPENVRVVGARPMLGFGAITGVEGVEEVVEGAGVVVVAAVSKSVRPGMAVDSLVIPRPPLEFLPLADDPGAATADTGADPDERDVVGLETAPAKDRDVAGAVVVVDVDFGATAVDAVEVRAVESLL